MHFLYRFPNGRPPLASGALLGRGVVLSDDERAITPAQLVAGPVYLVIAALVRMVVLVVGESDHIKNQMAMNGPLSIWEASTNSYLPPNLSFAICIPIPRAPSAETFLSKGLDQVAVQVCILIDGIASGEFKSNISTFGDTAEGGCQQFSVRPSILWIILEGSIF